MGFNFDGGYKMKKETYLVELTADNINFIVWMAKEVERLNSEAPAIEQLCNPSAIQNVYDHIDRLKESLKPVFEKVAKDESS